MRKGSCKHYNGSYHNKTCEAGVVYNEVTPDPHGPGCAYRIPCNRELSEQGLKVLKECGPQGTCDKYQEPSQDEIDSYEAAIAEHSKKFLTTIPLIKKVKQEHKGKDWAGVVVCPVCGGKLHVTHSSFNGHVWGNCETENCLSWME